MKPRTLIAIALLLTISSLAQSGTTFTTISSYNGDIKSQSLCPDGSVVVTGKNRQLIGPQYNDEIFVGKYDSNGVAQWEILLRDSGFDRYPMCIASDAESIYLCGYAAGLYPNTGWYNFVIRLALDGSFQWQRQIDSVSSLYDVIIYSDGGCIVAGSLSIQQGFSASAVTRIDSSGNILWSSAHRSTSGTGRYNDLVTDTLGNIFLCGSVTNGQYSSVGLLTKVDSAGTTLWSNQYEDSLSEIDFENCVLSNSMLWILGGSVNGIPSYQNVMIVLQIDLNGTLINAASMGDSTTSYYARGFCATMFNTVIISGYKGTIANHSGFIAEMDLSLNFVRGLQNPAWHEITDVDFYNSSIIHISGWNYFSSNYGAIRAVADNSWSLGCGFSGFSDSIIPATYNSIQNFNTIGSFVWTTGNSTIVPQTRTINTCDNLASIQDPVLEPPIVYPNPTSDNCTITFPQPATKPSIFDITDFTGKMVRLCWLDTGMQTLELDLSDLPAGIYFLKSNDGFVAKIVVAH